MVVQEKFIGMKLRISSERNINTGERNCIPLAFAGGKSPVDINYHILRVSFKGMGMHRWVE